MRVFILEMTGAKQQQKGGVKYFFGQIFLITRPRYLVTLVISP